METRSLSRRYGFHNCMKPNWYNGNIVLFELIHLYKNMKRNKDLTRCFLKIPFARKNNASVTCVLKIVLIFMNILSCKPSLI